MRQRVAVVVSMLLVVNGCGGKSGIPPPGPQSGQSPSPGAQPARAKVEGPRISVIAGSFKPTLFYGPWQCSQRWMTYCQRQCAAEGYTLKGCMWLADLKLDWEGRTHNAGGRYAITHCCCDYPVLSKDATQAARDRWEAIRESFREDWSKKFGNWPLERGKSWPGHHIRDLKHGGDPVDPDNILPTPPAIHDVLNKEYPRCYDGGPPWNTVGPDLPYSDY